MNELINNSITDTNNDLSKKIEAILFFKNEPVKKTWLEKILKKSTDEINKAITVLNASLSERGVVLVELNDSIALRTAPEYSDTLLELRKEELSKDIGKAGLETLSVIVYQSPITRAGVDYIRGVNSTFIIRNLMVRGLIEKKSNPKDTRSFLYRPTFSLLSLLGISNITELPEYEDVQKEIIDFKSSSGHDSSQGIVSGDRSSSQGIVSEDKDQDIKHAEATTEVQSSGETIDSET